jgi:hypothetical protein
MQLHFNKMTDEQRLEWLKLYEKQNPSKYLRKFGVITGRFPAGHPEAGQPCKWDYVPPEEAIKKIVPSFASTSGGLNVEITEKEKVVQVQEFTAPSQVTIEDLPKKRGRKPNV